MTEHVIVGKDCVYDVDPEITGVNGNIIVCGGTGSGKTMSVTEPRLLESNCTSLIVSVTKRRIIDKYRPLLKKRGYTVQELNLADPEKSEVAYDPLRYIRTEQDITYLAWTIVETNGISEKDPYWDNCSVSLLTSEIEIVLIEKGKKASFLDVLDFHQNLRISEDSNGLIKTPYQNDFDFLKSEYPKCLAVTCWESFCDLPIKTASCVYSSLNICLDKVFTSGLQKALWTGREVDFESIASRKTVLFLVTSPVNQSLDTYVSLFYSDAFKCLFEMSQHSPNGKLPNPVHIICDDFATGTKIPNFARQISIFREAGISVTLLIQSETQLAGLYGENDAATIINNCDTYIYMGGLDVQTAQIISKRVNKPLEDVLYMKVGWEFVIRRGQKPIYTERYNILDDVRYLEVTKQYEENLRSR